MTRPGQDDRSAAEPVLRVVRGDATPEEIAALVAVLLTRSGDDITHRPHHQARRSRSAWSDRSRQLRGPLYPGPGAWRRSALPG